MHNAHADLRHATRVSWTRPRLELLSDRLAQVAATTAETTDGIVASSS